MSAGKPDGFYIPIHKSLIEQQLIGGLPRNACIALWSLGGGIGVMMQIYWLLIPTFILHMLIRKATAKDGEFFNTVISHLQDKHYYEV